MWQLVKVYLVSKHSVLQRHIVGVQVTFHTFLILVFDGGQQTPSDCGPFISWVVSSLLDRQNAGCTQEVVRIWHIGSFCPSGFKLWYRVMLLTEVSQHMVLSCGQVSLQQSSFLAKFILPSGKSEIEVFWGVMPWCFQRNLPPLYISCWRFQFLLKH